MIDKLYTVISCFEILIFMIIILKYIYLENSFKSLREWIVFSSAYLLSIICCLCISPNNDWYILNPFLFAMIYIMINRKKRRIRGIFLIIPITGIIFSITVVPISFLYLFNSSMKELLTLNNKWSLSFDMIIWICIIALVLYGRKQNNQFYKTGTNRQLTRWERNLLNGTGLFLLIYSMLAVSIDNFKLQSVYSKCIIALGIIIVILMEAALIGMIMQGNSKFYFQNTAVLNEYYLKAQLAHFKAYKETQRETRRIRHDMKNHIACLYNLIEEHNFEEARQYILTLNEQVGHIDKELHCGNDIADAILNEKSLIASKDNIHIYCDGVFENACMDAVDVCTIFANALDNAMEALKQSSLEHKDIYIEFRKKQTMQYITFRNPVARGYKSDSFLTTKRDPLNHGFGLENIRLAVNKYNGNMNCQISSIDGQDYFILEILLFS